MQSLSAVPTPQNRIKTVRPRAQRAKPKSRRDDMKVAQGQRATSAALGNRPQTLYSPSPRPALREAGRGAHRLVLTLPLRRVSLFNMKPADRCKILLTSRLARTNLITRRLILRPI